ncbi:MAG: helix-turn-helix domain-containing protein [Trichodesmium sp. St16_bin4-tuft]|nr:helix-turn-helix domain-containing protein [Trichodesmium sp. MAG_R01]MDE5069448.1 helix-turn-helix domain-containing protein [Trichodesmium sp. St4_bin8_1]MDE5072199.1 helix-turn-helix domain-containing protein [Trichodesmium sp. St5_bin8]MDE5077600.1 helix-turn-helix domain-containing protein [Trichodesmium sp. St2_bin6]MDE5098339.1 helix-turn-helix domain-containing protein [Trichodesmium sp. St16_bin4-tuft]
MAGVCKIEITETVPELKTLLNHQKTVSGFQKIQALYLFKIGQVVTVKELAITLGVNRITVQRWLRQYRKEGISGLLHVKQNGGRKPAIPEEARYQLEKRLNDPDNGFESYGEIQIWLQKEYNINASYKAVYATVKYQLKTKLVKK